MFCTEEFGQVFKKAQFEIRIIPTHSEVRRTWNSGGKERILLW